MVVYGILTHQVLLPHHTTAHHTAPISDHAIFFYLILLFELDALWVAWGKTRVGVSAMAEQCYRLHFPLNLFEAMKGHFVRP